MGQSKHVDAQRSHHGYILHLHHCRCVVCGVVNILRPVLPYRRTPVLGYCTNFCCDRRSLEFLSPQVLEEKCSQRLLIFVLKSWFLPPHPSESHSVEPHSALVPSPLLLPLAFPRTKPTSMSWLTPRGWRQSPLMDAPSQNTSLRGKVNKHFSAWERPTHLRAACTGKPFCIGLGDDDGHWSSTARASMPSSIIHGKRHQHNLTCHNRSGLWTLLILALAGTNEVVSFRNLRKDARLVVPCKGQKPGANYAHLAAFVRTAPKEQVQ